MADVQSEQIMQVVQETVLPEGAVEALRARMRGKLLGPEDEGYDVARRVYNAMIDRYPRLIARCADVADVMAAVNFARENNLAVAIRGGGHNVAGFGTCDGCLVVDLSPMKGIRVDPWHQSARAQGGCTWGDLDHATHAFGLATPGGFVSSTGIGGLTLGGGVGYLTRRFGLTCDNLLSVDVVTADGRFLTASADENEDLFWGVRGGGGNFGVVTSFEYRLHPVSNVLGGPVFYPIEQAGDVLRFYRDFISRAPEELGAFFGFALLPQAPFVPAPLQGAPVCAIVLCYSGPREQADAVVGPARRFGPPALDLVGEMPYPALQSMFDPLVPPGLYNYWRADFMNDLSDEAIAVHTRYGPQVPTAASIAHIYPVNGAAHRVGKNETAFSYRDAEFVHVIAAAYPDPADTPKNKQWVQDYWSALHPYSAGGAYVNFMMEEGKDRVVATYRDNYDRLVELKNKHDPTNLFGVNQNIKPTVQAGK